MIDEHGFVDLRDAAEGTPATAETHRIGGCTVCGLRFPATGDPPPARLPSPVRGWHQIWLGFRGASGLRIRLAGQDPGFRRVETLVRWDVGDPEGEEVHWRDADLTGASKDCAETLVPFGELDAWRVLREAHDLYRQGADAVDVWEMGAAPDRPTRWNVLRRIGDRAFLEAEFGTRIRGLMQEPDHPLRFEDGGKRRGT